MNNLTVIEHKNQRVLTTAQLAEGYDTEPIKIQQNFNNNRERYVLGVHYFYLEGAELKSFKDSLENFEVVQKNSPSLILWTEKGAFLHAKSLNTDKAWQVYEMLVDSYFQKQIKPASLEDLIILQAQSVKELKSKVLEIESTVTASVDKTEVLEKRLDNLIDIDITQPKRDVLNAYVKRYSINNCKSNFSQAWKDFYNAFYYATGMKVKTRADNAKQTVPKWLEANEYLDTAIKSTDNMLNK